MLHSNPNICNALWTKPIRGTAKGQQGIGLELEMFAFDANTFAPLGTPNSKLRPQDIIVRLNKLIPASHLKLDPETSEIVGLILADGGNYSLEPGGQIEYSSKPFSSLKELAADMEQGLRRLEEAGNGEVVFADHGTNPVADASLPLLVPKIRYQILNRYFESEKGGRGTHMMRHTATVQPNLDVHGDEAWQDAVNLTWVLTPFVRHLFSNSRYFHGKKSQYHSERQAIWESTDHTRTGIPPVVFAENITCAYADWAKNANVFFIENLPLEEQPLFGELTFKDWLEKGYKGSTPTLSDWETHLGTLFPDLRLRGFLEVRSVDAQSFEHVLAPAAFWSGLLQSREGRERAREFLLGIALGVQNCTNTCSSADSNSAFLKLLSLPSDHAVFRETHTHMQLIDIAIDALAARNESVGVASLQAYKNYIQIRNATVFPENGIDFLKSIATKSPASEFVRYLNGHQSVAVNK